MHEAEDLSDSLERLVCLGRSPDVDIRPVLLRVVVDLFVRKPHHAPDELAQFEEITRQLLDEADPETRLTIAEKLSRHPDLPQGLARRLLADGGATAARVLQHAELDAETLVGSAVWGSPDLAIAVANRADLWPAICHSLAERPEPEVLLALAGNSTAPIDRRTLQYLIRRAREHRDLAASMLRRDCPPADLAPLFLMADTATRAAILLAVRQDDLGPESHRPRLSTNEVAALSRVERALLNADQDSFDVAFAVALGLDLDTTGRLLDDPHGEPLALALAAIGASAEFAARVFILSGSTIGQSVMAVRTLTQLVATMPMRTAARLVSAMTNAGTKPRPHRSPPAGQDTRRARRTETETRPAAADEPPVQTMAVGA